MFNKETYISRRSELKRLVGKGLIILFGNNESPYNYPANGYAPMRQDSAFIYYFGSHRDGLVGVIDIDNDTDMLLGDDVSVEDIVWLGTVGSVKSLAESAGISVSLPVKQLAAIVRKAQAHGKEIHFLPPYRFDTQIAIMDLLGIHPSEQKEKASVKLIKAVVKMRSKKSAEEIEIIDRACDIGYLMHTKAMSLCREGVSEKYIAGQMDGIALSHSQAVSFPTICTQHGEIMHGIPKDAPLEGGRLLLCDAGCEKDDYCSDNTRTMPVSGKFTTQQREIYQIVVDCHDLALQMAKPGILWRDVHYAVCTLMATRLKELGLMKGDTDEAVAVGAHALFLPHGLGHMMGMDVHDMEGLGQNYVGFDDEVQPRLDQFGIDALRMGRRLEEGFVVTDEPGIYFIPALIDDWRDKGLHTDFINYEKIEPYRDFGGIRIEDDVLVTSAGARFLGTKRIPYYIADVEKFMEENKQQSNS
ncbi:MAG: aminopeptidase P family protein [Prevotella sp.]|nr:aminopeptidase P family protein [Prevotella sp.]